MKIGQVNDVLDSKELLKAVLPVVGSKQYGYEKFLAEMVVQACLDVLPKSNPRNFNVDNVRVVKVMGASILDSMYVRGMVFGREPEGKTIIYKFGKISEYF